MVPEWAVFDGHFDYTSISFNSNRRLTWIGFCQSSILGSISGRWWAGGELMGTHCSSKMQEVNTWFFPIWNCSASMHHLTRALRIALRNESSTALAGWEAEQANVKTNFDNACTNALELCRIANSWDPAPQLLWLARRMSGFPCTTGVWKNSLCAQNVKAGFVSDCDQETKILVHKIEYHTLNRIRLD